MQDIVYDFRSDNVAGAAPEILDALIAANSGTTAPYGDDAFTRGMNERFCTVFEREVRAFPLTTGTGANAVALAAAANQFGSIYCHESAHINVYECGAPELFTGAKLYALPGADYKLHAARLREERVSSPPPRESASNSQLPGSSPCSRAAVERARSGFRVAGAGAPAPLRSLRR